MEPSFILVVGAFFVLTYDMCDIHLQQNTIFHTILHLSCFQPFEYGKHISWESVMNSFEKPFLTILFPIEWPNYMICLLPLSHHLTPCGLGNWKIVHRKFDETSIDLCFLEEMKRCLHCNMRTMLYTAFWCPVSNNSNISTLPTSWIIFDSGIHGF